MGKGKQIHVGFLSFFKLSLLYGLALGQLAGVGCLVEALCGFSVHLDLGSWHLHGVPAAVGFLILLPPLCGLGALVLAPLLYLPFLLACRVFGGFK